MLVYRIIHTLIVIHTEQLDFDGVVLPLPEKQRGEHILKTVLQVVAGDVFYVL
jgi:hypothetical protein